MTLKDIIIDALVESNLVPRKRVAPADMLESAHRLLQGIMRKYSFANFISYSRESLEIIPTDNVIELDIPKATSISNVQYKMSEDVYKNLRFVAFEQFFADPDIYTYTWKYTEDNTIQIILKKEFVSSSNKTIVIYYNTSMNIGLDDEVKMPEIYKELFTTSLTYKLAITYPRLSESKIAILKSELESLEKDVTSLVSSNKILTRDVSSVSNFDSFMSGSFIFGR